MKKITLLFLLCFSLMAHASAPDMKVGIVNIREVMQKAPQAEKINTALEKEFLPRKNAIIAAQKALQEKNEKYQRDSELMSDAERKKSEKELLEKQRDLQRMEAEYREDAQTRQREETDKLLSKISEVINTIAKEDSFDLLLHKEAVPFSSNKLDVTDKVLAKLKTVK